MPAVVGGHPFEDDAVTLLWRAYSSSPSYRAKLPVKKKSQKHPAVKRFMLSAASEFSIVGFDGHSVSQGMPTPRFILCHNASMLSKDKA